MTITKADLKAKRLQAMAIVGSQMDASADMFDRVIAAGQKVATARAAAEAAQMAAIDAQVADLNEMADEFTDMGNAAAPATTVTAAPAPSTSSTGTAALASLMAAQPNPVKPANTIATEALKEGNAYAGTHGELKG